MDIDAVLTQPPLPLSTGEAEAVAEQIYGITGTATRLTGERDGNFRISTSHGDFALKVLNPAERPSVVEMQMLLLRHIAGTDATLPVPRPIRTVDGDVVGRIETVDGTTAVSLVTFLDGSAMPLVEATSERLDAIAAALARLHPALVGFSHPEERRVSTWDLTQGERLRPFVEALPVDRRDASLQWVDTFESSLSDALGRLPTQMIHSDFNQENLLVGSDREIVGIIDFADATRAARVVDVAIAAAYACLGSSDPAATAAGFVSAYQRHARLEPEAIAIAPDLIMGRLVQSYSIGVWRAELHPENRDYILIHSRPAWNALEAVSADMERLRTLVADGCA